MGKLLKCHLNGKTCSKLANGLKFYVFKKKLTPGVALTQPWCYIHVYYHSSQTSLLVYISASGERLEDHWSSGLNSFENNNNSNEIHAHSSCYETC